MKLTPLNFILSTLLAFLVVSQPVHGQFGSADDKANIDLGGLDVEFEIGWDGLVDQSFPVPISFQFSNYSGGVVDAELFLVDHLNGNEASLGKVYLSQEGRRKFTAIRAMNNWYECFAELRAGGDVIWRRELALNTSRDFTLGVNYALVVNDSGRALKPPKSERKPPTQTPNYYYNAPQQLPMVTSQGRMVDYAQMKTWQVPTHPGPLLPVKAIIFPEGTFDADLNRGQWQAIADWMCQGGTVFVHSESRKILEQLQRRSHLTPDPPFQAGHFSMRRVGLGAICEYPEELFATDNSPSNEHIADYVATVPDDHFASIPDSGYTHQFRGGQADWNRLLVAGFFGLYALFSGFFALLMFRRSRRFVGIYTVCVVTFACVGAAVLGGFLRMSRGDLRSITVTQAGPGGAVQVGKVEVFSAGARNTRVAVSGKNVDLQSVEINSRYRRYNQRRQSIHPFTFQRSLLEDEEDAYQVNVGMPPWGSRRVHATAFSASLQPLEFKLKFDTDNNRNVTLKLKNTLPFTMRECLLVVAYATKLPEKDGESAKTPQPQFAPWQPQAQQQRTDVYAMHGLRDLASTESLDQQIPLRFKKLSSRWEMRRGFSTGQIDLPSIGRESSAEAWIIGRLENSPIIQIDEDRTEFIPDQHLHLFMQRIRPEDLQGIERLIGTQDPAEPTAVGPN